MIKKMIVNNPYEISAFFQSHRTAAKETQAELGIIAGIRQQTIADFEKDCSKAQLSTLFKIANAAGYNIQLIRKDEPLGDWGEEW